MHMPSLTTRSLLALSLAATTAAAAPPRPKPAARAAPAARSAPSPFPFPIHQQTLPNGLKVVVIPTGLPDLVSIQIPVSTGSRNEVEPGKSGFAHFFEHMMFRGTKDVSKEQWNAALQETGASQNAYTSDDLTNYYTLVSKADLERWLRLEADRFQHLAYDEAAFKTEARAVLGEYNKNSSEPTRKLFEVMRNAAFQTHPYKHTTLGFLSDIEAMPTQYAYSKEFFARWYRPDNVTVILTGDVTPETAFPLVRKYFGPWPRSTQKTPPIPAEPEPTAPVEAHVSWHSPTLPWVAVSFHAPAFSTTQNHTAALELLGELWFGEQSELYQRLVRKEQLVDELDTDGGRNRDPGLFTILARVKKLEDVATVRDAILDACARAQVVPVPADRLDDVKTELRLSLARNLDSTQAIASQIARLTSYSRDPEALAKLARLREGVTVADLSRLAQTVFVDRKRVVTTLYHGAQPPALTARYDGIAERAARLSTLPALRLIEEAQPQSPLVDVRVQFRVGSIHDPAGREGLARLAAAMITDSGTSERSLAELTTAYARTGTRLSYRVDKELTSFSFTVPRDTCGQALDLLVEQLTRAGFRDEDFRRLKAQQQNELGVGLKANNDEELGKVALEARMYEGAYSHPVLGTTSGLDHITLDDVRAFMRAYYSQPRLLLGLGGGYQPEHKEALLRGLGALPTGDAPRVTVSEAEHHPGTRLAIVTKNTRATAISFGLPLRERDAQGNPIDARVNRLHPDFAALWVATAYLGQHRNSTGRLYQRLRELRGLNYGDYAYLEAFPGGGFQFQVSPGVLRTFNHWQVWIRPVAPQNGVFALKAALFEIDRLLKDGIGDAGFTATRTFLVKFLDHLTDTGQKRLGHDLDQARMGLGPYAATFKAKLQALTRADVDRVLRKYLRTSALDIVVVTQDADAFKRDLAACRPPVYDAPKPELTAEDAAICSVPLDLAPERTTVLPIDTLFQ